MTETQSSKHYWSFQVLEAHLDTFGHMNHATYLQIFEQARWELITSRGFGLKVIMEKKIGPTILEANIKFRRELRLREQVQVETYCAEYKGKIGIVHQRMINAKGEEAAILVLTVGLFDMEARRLIAASPEWLHSIGWGS